MSQAIEQASGLVDPAPYALLLPTARIRPGTPAHQLPRFADLRWPLHLLDHLEHGPVLHHNWELTPTPLRFSLMRAGWAVLNLPAPAAMVATRAAARTHLAPGTLVNTFGSWRLLAKWLAEHSLTRLSDVQPADLEQYAAEVGAKYDWRVAIRHTLEVTRLWAYAPFLLPEDRLVMPPWEEPGAEMGTFLGQRKPPSSENSTAIVHPAVMSPLLIWSLRMVLDFSSDILAAQHEHARLAAAIPRSGPEGGEGMVVDHLLELLDTGQPIPTFAGRHADTITGRMLPGCTHSKALATTMLAGTLGVTRNQVVQAHRALRRELADHHFGAGAPLDIPVIGKIDGKPWKPFIDHAEVRELRVHLGTAAMIVAAYLSGLRPVEVLHLERGCCTRTEQGDGTVRYTITGKHFKGVIGDDGAQVPDGEVRRDPWTVIDPVQRAIAVLEQLHDDRLLFSRSLSMADRQRPHSGQALTAETAGDRIGRFTRWVNTLAAGLGRDAELIPEDPAGLVTLRRFRRTLAWFIRRQPGGAIALAVQYGHIDTLIGESYAGRSTADMLAMLDFERGLAMADTLAQAADQINSGQGVSGPAAQRYIAAASEYQNKYAGAFMTRRQLTALLANPRLQVYQHPQAFTSCNYDPFKALCDAGAAADEPSLKTPSLSRCDSRCPNLSRSDADIAAAHEEIDALEAELAGGINPYPIQQRLGQRRTGLLHLIDQHESTRTVPTPNSKATT